MRKLSHFEFNKSNVIFQISVFLVAALTYFLPFLSSKNATLKTISVLVRYNNTRFLPFLILALILVLSLKNVRLSILLTALVVFPICALALIGLWASMYTETNVITGILPRIDALSYYTSAMALLEKGTLAGYTQRRPFFSSFFAVLLSISNRNLQVTLIIFAFFCAIALFLILIEVRRILNPFAAVIFFIPQFFYYRMYIGNIMSETLGFLLGMISFLFFLRAIANPIISSKRSLIYFSAAAFLFTLSQLTRPGALLTIPLYILFAGWTYSKNKKFSFKAASIVLGCIFIAYFFNSLMFSRLALSSSNQLNNAGFGIYGVVAGGKSWAQLMTDFPEIVTLPPGLREREILRVIITELVTHPGNFFKGMMVQFGYIFSLFPIYDTNIYSYLLSSSNVVDGIFIGSFYILSLLGLTKIILTHRNSFSIFIGVLLVGFFLSLPISPAYQSRFMRYYPATIPMLGILPAIGVEWIFRPKSVRSQETSATAEISLPFFEFCLVISSFLMLLGPFFLVGFSPQKTYKGTTCPPDETQVLMPFYLDSYVRVETITKTWAPNISLEDFQQSVINIPNVLTKDYFRSLTTPKYIFPSINLLDNGVIYVLLDEDLIPTQSTVLSACGHVQDENEEPSRSGFFLPTYLEEATLNE